VKYNVGCHGCRIRRHGRLQDVTRSHGRAHAVDWKDGCAYPGGFDPLPLSEAPSGEWPSGKVWPIPPEGDTRVEPPAACLQFRGREDIAARPKPGLERGGITFGQAALPHFRCRRGVVVVECMVLDKDAIIGWRKRAEPDARRSVVRWHADDTGVVPEMATNLTGEGQTTMAGDYAVATGGDQFLLDCLVVAGEDETVDAGHTAMNDNEATAVDLEFELSR